MTKRITYEMDAIKDKEYKVPVFAVGKSDGELYVVLRDNQTGKFRLCCLQDKVLYAGTIYGNTIFDTLEEALNYLKPKYHLFDNLHAKLSNKIN